MNKIPKEVCLRCGGGMKPDGERIFDYMGYVRLFHDTVETMVCTECGRIEIYQTGELALPSPPPERACSRCGKDYRADLKECPHCAFPNEAQYGYSDM